ncbi:MAG: hypothetical protein ACR2LT_01925 [Pyrinomonadaceae bacterium]
MNLFFGIAAFAQTQNDTDSRLVLNVKNTVARVGTEPNRKIKITLKDGTKLKGYVTEIKDDYFTVLDTKSGKVISVQYSQVAEAKPKSSSGIKKALGDAAIRAGVGIAVITISTLIIAAALKN